MFINTIEEYLKPVRLLHYQLLYYFIKKKSTFDYISNNVL